MDHADMTAPMPETMSPREKVELKPCPFCGGYHLKCLKVFSEDEPSYQIGWQTFCEVCHAHGPASVRIGWCETEADAQVAWNRRAALASSGDHAELIEDATEALQIIDAFPSNQGEVEGRITEKGARLIASCTRDARLALEAIIAEVAELRANEKAALKECAEWARKAGEAIGKLETSEAAGIVEGWQTRATEAERKLAEAVSIASKLSTAISWLDYPFVDNNTSEDELRSRVGFMMKDAEQPRAMLSKEAERG